MTHWHALPGPAQVALAWAVNIGGHAWTSELAALADLEAAGLVHRDADDSSWTATDKGRAIYHERNEIPSLDCPICGDVMHTGWCRR